MYISRANDPFSFHLEYTNRSYHQSQPSPSKRKSQNLLPTQSQLNSSAEQAKTTDRDVAALCSLALLLAELPEPSSTVELSVSCSAPSNGPEHIGSTAFGDLAAWAERPRCVGLVMSRGSGGSGERRPLGVFNDGAGDCESRDGESQEGELHVEVVGGKLIWKKVIG